MAMSLAPAAFVLSLVIRPCTALNGQVPMLSHRAPALLRVASPPTAAVALRMDALALVVPGIAAVPAPARDTACAVVLAVAAKVWVKLWSWLASSGKLPSTLTRKLIHAGTGPLFVLGWPLFSDAPTAVLFACAVPVINLARLWLAGQSRAGSDGAELISSLSRSGDAKEVVGGPFYYTLVLLLATALSWRSIAGVVAVCQMAVGDGFADIIGRKLGKNKWPFSPDKSIEGSAAFALSAFVSSLLMLGGCHALGYTSLTMSVAALPLLVISVACAGVELFPQLGDDNLTVPFFGALLAKLLLCG